MAETAKKTATKKTAAKKTATKKTAAKKTAAKKPAAKKAAAKKAPTSKATAPSKTSTATKSSSAAKRGSAAETPESTYLTAALDATTKLSDEITSAGEELTDRLMSLSGEMASATPDDALEALGRAAAANDVAEFLRSHHNFAEATVAAGNDANNAYRIAVSDYAVRIADAWRNNSDTVAGLFTDYVNSVTGQLDLSDPSSIARVGWSLVAASQAAPSVSDAASSASTTGAG